MIKKLRILLLAAGCLACLSSKEQVIISILFGKKLNTDKLEFGLTVGANYSDLSGIEASRKVGLNLALYFNIKMSQNFFLHIEASPKFGMGAKDIAPYPIGDENLDTLLQSSVIRRQLKYMTVPVLAKYRIKGLFFAMAGPQISMKLGATDEFETDVKDQDLLYSNKVKDQFSLFDVGLVGGVEYKFKKDKGMGLSLRYYQGLVDILKDESITMKNNAFQIAMTIPIGVGKSKEEKVNAQQK